jgi:hypothetical protein
MKWAMEAAAIAAPGIERPAAQLRRQAGLFSIIAVE